MTTSLERAEGISERGIMKASRAIKNQPNLDALFYFLKALEEEIDNHNTQYDLDDNKIRIEDIIDLHAMPTFGPVHDSSDYIYSWDATRVLGLQEEGWKLEPRHDLDQDDEDEDEDADVEEGE